MLLGRQAPSISRWCWAFPPPIYSSTKQASRWLSFCLCIDIMQNAWNGCHRSVTLRRTCTNVRRYVYCLSIKINKLKWNTPGVGWRWLALVGTMTPAPAAWMNESAKLGQQQKIPSYRPVWKYHQLSVMRPTQWDSAAAAIRHSHPLWLTLTTSLSRIHTTAENDR